MKEEEEEEEEELEEEEPRAEIKHVHTLYSSIMVLFILNTAQLFDLFFVRGFTSLCSPMYNLYSESP
jgi:hypothetical protein